MNYGMSAGDQDRRDPIVVYDFNGKPGDTFRVFYSHEMPATAAPACNTPRSDIGGTSAPVLRPLRSRAASAALNSQRLSLHQLPTPKVQVSSGLGVCFWELAQGQSIAGPELGIGS